MVVITVASSFMVEMCCGCVQEEEKEMEEVVAYDFFARVVGCAAKGRVATAP